MLDGSGLNIQLDRECRRPNDTGHNLLWECAFYGLLFPRFWEDVSNLDFIQILELVSFQFVVFI